MSLTQFWVGALVPPFIKWTNLYLKKFFKLSEFDAKTQQRIIAKQYPFYDEVLGIRGRSLVCLIYQSM